jgi:hypothetical protein
MKCPICQFENESGALFCEQCKSDLGALEPASPLQLVMADPASTLSENVQSASAEADTPIAAVVVEGQAAVDTLPLAEIAPLAVGAEGMLALAEAETVPPPAEGVAAPAPAAEPGIPVSSSAPSDEYVKLPSGANPKLVVVRGQRLNEEFPIYEGENYVGRADEKAVDVDLEDQEPPDRIWSSRQHALIVLRDGVLTLEDLNSTNGTFVNRLRVHAGQKRSLQPNDVIQIGTVQMRVTV